MLGGIIHGFKIPVSGLMVGSCAVVCICLIGWYVPQERRYIKATMIVAIFKMMLSPQAPPPAYIAVFFQGLMGELLFWKKRFYSDCPVYCWQYLAYWNRDCSGYWCLQLVYGNDLWKVINDFINGLPNKKQLPITAFSLGVVMCCCIY